VKTLSTIVLRIQQQPEHYGGAALPDPIALRCGAGSMPSGNWSEVGALKYYSGRIWYRRTERLTNEQIEGQVILDLGKVVFITRFPITIKPRQVIIKAIRYPD
jgi:hypothetical protein